MHGSWCDRLAAASCSGFNDNLTLGAPVPIGARKANLSAQAQAHMEEVALNEQGHALFTRQVSGSCCAACTCAMHGILTSLDTDHHGERICRPCLCAVCLCAVSHHPKLCA